MSYQISLNKNVLTLKLYDTVDLSETSEIKQALNDEPKSGIDKLVVDGGQIAYLDSSAVALLLFAKRIATDNGMDCEYLPFSEEAFKVINMAGLQATFNAKKAESSEPSPDADEGFDLDNLDINMDEFDGGNLMLDSEKDSPLQSLEEKHKSTGDPLDIEPGSFS